MLAAEEKLQCAALSRAAVAQDTATARRSPNTKETPTLTQHQRQAAANSDPSKLIPSFLLHVLQIAA